MNKHNDEKEIWRDIENCGGLYKVSNLGRIMSCAKNIIVRQRLNKGYLVINLYKNKEAKTLQVHRLVAAAFLKNPLDKLQVNHLDEDKTNNRWDNLAWATPAENVNWGTRNKRASKAVAQIDKKTNCVIAVFGSVQEAAQKTKLLMSEISRCCNYKAKTTGGYKFNFL